MSDEIEKLREELAEANARRDDLRTALEWANEERDRLRERCETLANNHEHRVEEMAALRKERDEARREASDHRLAAMAASSAHDAIEKMVRFELRAQQEEGAQEACRRVARERDEARAECESLRKQVSMLNMNCETHYEHGRKVGRWLDEAIEQRDEARAEVAELRADYDRVVTDLRRCASEPYEHAPERADAYRRGAEAMREACARHVEGEDEMFADNGLRALPIPEDTP